MDVYHSQKIKAILSLLRTILIIDFYSSLVDFYYIGPYLINLISSFKFLCKSKTPNVKQINKVWLDINTMIINSISLFNGFNRSVIKDITGFLGEDTIYNEKCFLNIRGTNTINMLLEISRDYSGSKEFNDIVKNGKICEKKRRSENKRK